MPCPIRYDPRGNATTCCWKPCRERIDPASLDILERYDLSLTGGDLNTLWHDLMLGANSIVPAPSNGSLARRALPIG